MLSHCPYLLHMAINFFFYYSVCCIRVIDCSIKVYLDLYNGGLKNHRWCCLIFCPYSNPPPPFPSLVIFVPFPYKRLKYSNRAVNYSNKLKQPPWLMCLWNLSPCITTAGCCKNMIASYKFYCPIKIADTIIEQSTAVI